MKNFILVFISISILWVSIGPIFSKVYYFLEGIAQLSKPCFDVIHDEFCGTSLPEIYSVSVKGVDNKYANTKVYLFTSKNPDKAEPLHQCGGRLPKNSDFDPDVDTVVIFHGWMDGMCRTGWMREMKQQLFIRGNYNVILTDSTWGNTIDPLFYKLNPQVIGEQAGYVIKQIMIQKKIDGDKFHLIGHSSGAIAASACGKFIQKWKKDSILRRITALDLPLFPVKDIPQNQQVSNTDAKFVDVIHTNVGEYFPLNMGNKKKSGHVDFFPNGGSVQISCIPYIYTSLLKMDFLYALASLYPPNCFHMQAIQYFKESINHPKGLYVGVECNNYDDFRSGACKRCCKDNATGCAVAGMDAELYFPHKEQPRQERSYYFNTANLIPYEEDYDFSICKDCQERCNKDEFLNKYL